MTEDICEEDFSDEEREETYEQYCERKAEEEYEAMQIDKHFAQERGGSDDTLA